MSGVVRRPGDGCPTLVEKDPALLVDPRRLVEPATVGDPMRPLMWVSKSYAKLATQAFSRRQPGWGRAGVSGGEEARVSGGEHRPAA